MGGDLDAGEGEGAGGPPLQRAVRRDADRHRAAQRLQVGVIKDHPAVVGRGAEPRLPGPRGHRHRVLRGGGGRGRGRRAPVRDGHQRQALEQGPLHAAAPHLRRLLQQRGPPGFGGHYNITLKATANSTLLPTINAAEFFSVVSTANVATDTKDVVAMAAIKAKYEVKKNWAGDPCTPKTLVWEGLNCSYAMSMPPRITRLNISFGGLRGSIQSHFANLKAIKYLDLSYNNFTGSIPNALSELPFLVPL